MKKNFFYKKKNNILLSICLLFTAHADTTQQTEAVVAPKHIVWMTINMKEIEEAMLSITVFKEELDRLSNIVRQAEEDLQKKDKKVKSLKGLSETLIQQAAQEYDQSFTNYHMIVQKMQESVQSLQVKISEEFNKALKEIFGKLKEKYKYDVLLREEIIVEAPEGTLKDLTKEAVEMMPEVYKKLREKGEIASVFSPEEKKKKDLKDNKKDSNASNQKTSQKKKTTMPSSAA